MIHLQTWSLSYLAATMLAVVALALSGYLVGRRQRQMRGKKPSDARHEITRAITVAHDLDSIACRLRAAFADHLPEIARFQRVLRRFEAGSGGSWRELCDRADKLLTPTLRLSTEISHSYAEILRQMSHLSSFAELRADPLTGVKNRRAFDESMEACLAEQARYLTTLSLAMIDIDGFKKINDQHGHLHGDRVLQELAALLKANVRECDLLFRYGGEEFAVLMPHTELHAACHLAERIRAAVASNMVLTVSIGLSELMPGDTANTFVNRADTALYAAKNGGRNCVHLHEGASGRIVGVRSTSEQPSPPCPGPAELALPVSVEGAATSQLQAEAC